MLFHSLANYEVEPDNSVSCTFFCPIKNRSIVQAFRPERLTVDNIQRWIEGESIQVAMPNLTDGERELFLTALIDEEYDALFEENEDACGFDPDEPAF